MEQALIKQVKKLLQSTGSIIEKHEEIARLKGENFNVFRLLGIEDKEVKLHSPFIAELLDPKGSHDQKTAFLKMFLEQIVDPLPSDHFPKGCKARPDESRAEVYREYYIGPMHIDGKNSTGGFIDIFITDGTRHVSIENKIGSGEGEHQTTRYCNHKPDSNLVLFLTPLGKRASTDKAYPISYKKHIIPWLESCQKHCADLPILRETIKQYIITIKGLTGGLTMQEMNKKLKQLMRENIEAAQAIHSNYEPLFKEIVEEFVQEIKKEIKGKEPVSSSPNDWKIKIYHNSGGGLYIRNIKWIETDLRKTSNEDHLLPEDHLLLVNWQGIYKQSFYGISADPEHFNRKKIKKKLDGIGLKSSKYKWWPFYTYTKEANFQDLNQLKKLLQGQEKERTKLVEEIANKLIALMVFCNGKLIPEDSR